MTPVETVRESLRASRADGLDFETAWPIAIALVPAVDHEATLWRSAILASWETWRRAYRGAPATRADVRARSLSALAAR